MPNKQAIGRGRFHPGLLQNPVKDLALRFCAGLRAGILLGFPGLELPEQRFLVGFAELSCSRALLEEFIEPVARHRLDAVLVKPYLGGGQALPVGKRSG